MDTITSLIPVVRSVRLGSRAFPVWEARLSDLALLQAWLDGKWGDPFTEAMEAVADDATWEESRGVMVAAHAKIEAGPPVEGTAEGFNLFRSPEGVGVFLSVSLSRGTPTLTPDDIVGISREMTPTQYSALRRVFFGITQIEAVERYLSIEVEPENRSEGGRLTWGEAVDEVARTYGWTYPAIYAMSVSEFANARRGGKPPKRGELGPATAETIRAQCIRFHGKPPEEVWPTLVVGRVEPSEIAEFEAMARGE